MDKSLNLKFAKYIDPNLYEALHDLEITKGCPFGEGELAGLVDRVTDPTRKLPSDFIADCLDEIALLYRELHEKREFALFRLQNQELVSQ